VIEVHIVQQRLGRLICGVLSRVQYMEISLGDMLRVTGVMSPLKRMGRLVGYGFGAGSLPLGAGVRCSSKGCSVLGEGRWEVG